MSSNGNVWHIVNFNNWDVDGQFTILYKIEIFAEPFLGDDDVRHCSKTG
jgi:hypothetical protein